MSRSAASRALGAAGLGLLLHACTVTPERPLAAEVAPAWRARSAQLEVIDSWELQGRVAVRAGNEGGQMSLHWRQRPASQVLDFSGPLGKRLFHLTQDAHGAQARTSDGTVHQASDAQMLIENLTGWRLPVAALQYWLRGLPLPAVAAATQFDREARLVELMQAGWRVQFLDYMRVEAYELPRKLALSHSADASTAADIEVKLAIERWILP